MNKNKIFYLLIAAVLILNLVTFNICKADNVNGTKNIDQQMKNKKKEIDNMKGETSNLTKEIKELDEEMTKVGSELEKAEKELKSLNIDIDKTEKELKAAEKRMNEKKGTLDSRLRVMYKNGNVGYLEVLLSSANIKDFLARKEMVQAVVNYDVDLLEYIKEQKDIIDKKEKELKSQRDSVKIAKEKAREKKNELVAATRSKEVAMDKLEKDIKLSEAEYAELEQESKQIAAEISRKQLASATSSRGKTGSRSNNSSNSGGNASAPSGGGGSMAWPAPGPVTSPYGMRWGRLHSGIDIGVSVGTPVVAARDGVVVLTRTGYGGGYGNYIVVDHGGGISTLYAHNSSLSAGVGARVSRGQVIAISGNTGRSTGPHLHFEVRVNGNPVNPMPYLR